MPRRDPPRDAPARREALAPTELPADEALTSFLEWRLDRARRKDDET